MAKSTNSVIDYRELRAQKARLELRNEDLKEATGLSGSTVSAVLGGSEDVRLGSIMIVAKALKLRAKVTFEPDENPQTQTNV